MANRARAAVVRSLPQTPNHLYHHSPAPVATSLPSGDTATANTSYPQCPGGGEEACAVGAEGAKEEVPGEAAGGGGRCARARGGPSSWPDGPAAAPVPVSQMRVVKSTVGGR